MGGGTSGLFFGTKGSRQEYQYSLFPDQIRKDSSESTERIGNTVFQNYKETSTGSEKQIITVLIVLKKCGDYRAGSISAQQLLEWLSFVTVSRSYRMKQLLRSTIRNAVYVLSSSLRYNDLSVFDRELTEFENRLRLLH